MTLRSQLALSGLAGVAGGAALMGGAVWLLPAVDGLAAVDHRPGDVGLARPAPPLLAGRNSVDDLRYAPDGGQYCREAVGGVDQRRLYLLRRCLRRPFSVADRKSQY